ncbi:hypothetical protein [Kocuria dechangensis]|nr:hypothetical protein [Kocuria dechangensis]
MDITDRTGHFLPIELLMFRQPSAEALVVHLHGSLDRQKYEIPRFERVATMEDLPYHQLWLADPTLHLDPGLRIGWYCGGSGEDSTDRLARLINEIAAQLGVEKIVIQGSSSGGFGALALTTRVPGSLALAFSPQTNMGRFSLGRSASWLVKAAFPEYVTYADFEDAEPTRADLGSLYADFEGGRAWYIQNSGDIDHLETQMYPFQPQVDDRVTFVLEHHCTGHNPPTPQRVRGWVEHAVANYHGDPQTFRLGAPASVPADSPGPHDVGPVSVVQLEHLDDFRPMPEDPEQRYVVGIGDGMALAFVARPCPSKNRVLRVGFSGTESASVSHRLSLAERDGLGKLGQPYILFADPTPGRSPDSRTSWYLGTPDVDPDDAMELITRRVMAASGSPYLLAEGSSANGFVALRFSSRFHNAVAVPESPQTDLLRGPFRVWEEMFSAGWTGWSPTRVVAECSHRFRVMDRYTDSRWNRGNLVHYVHNAGDGEHVLEHLTPLLEEFGASPGAIRALGGRFRFSTPYIGEGPATLPHASRSAEHDLAIAWLKRQRPVAAQEGVFTAPEGRSQDRGSPAARARHLAVALAE